MLPVSLFLFSIPCHVPPFFLTYSWRIYPIGPPVTPLRSLKERFGTYCTVAPTLIPLPTSPNLFGESALPPFCHYRIAAGVLPRPPFLISILGQVQLSLLLDPNSVFVPLWAAINPLAWP